MSTSKTITRTDLTNILNEVLPVQAGIRTTVVTSGNISLTIIKSGGIVQVFSFGSFPATNDGTTIVTIPDGFRPKQTTDYTVFDVDGVRLGTLRFFYDGRVVPTFGNLKAGNVRACWTYISSADYIPADADVVIEQGTSGVWTYRKWNSGLAECWGTGTIGSNSACSINYPITFTSVTHCVATCSYLSSGTYVAPTIAVQPLIDHVNLYARVSTSTVTSPHTVYCEVKGRWK